MFLFRLFSLSSYSLVPLVLWSAVGWSGRLSRRLSCASRPKFHRRGTHATRNSLNLCTVIGGAALNIPPQNEVNRNELDALRSFPSGRRFMVSRLACNQHLKHTAAHTSFSQFDFDSIGLQWFVRQSNYMHIMNRETTTHDANADIVFCLLFLVFLYCS